jgi:hypothetical protein
MPLPETMQLVGLKVPVPLVLQVTDPVGVIGVPGDVSVTLAWHVVECLGRTALGEQVTLIDEERLVTCRLVEPELP